MSMSSALRLALIFLFFGSYGALAEERPVPEPYTQKLVGGDFCLSVHLLEELITENNQTGITSRQKDGCGELVIPMDFTFTPIEWFEIDSQRILITKIKNHHGEIAYILFYQQ